MIIRPSLSELCPLLYARHYQPLNRSRQMIVYDRAGCRSMGDVTWLLTFRIKEEPYPVFMYSPLHAIPTLQHTSWPNAAHGGHNAFSRSLFIRKTHHPSSINTQHLYRHQTMCVCVCVNVPVVHIHTLFHPAVCLAARIIEKSSTSMWNGLNYLYAITPRMCNFGQCKESAVWLYVFILHHCFDMGFPIVCVSTIPFRYILG